MQAWNKKENPDKGIFLSSSKDDGQNFSTPKHILNIEGETRDIRMIAKDDFIVLTILEAKNNDLVLRAVTVHIDETTLMYNFKPCEQVEIQNELKGKLINTYTEFTEDASIDFIYTVPNPDVPIPGSNCKEPTDNTVKEDGKGHCALSYLLHNNSDA